MARRTTPSRTRWSRKLPQLAMVQGVEEALDVHLQDPAPSHLHQASPQRLQRLMRRATRPKAVRAVQKVLLVDRLQHHRHRPLKHLVLEGRDADGPRRLAVALRDVHPPHRGRPVRPGLDPVEQRLEVLLQVAPRTPPPSGRPPPPPRPSACAGTPRAATRRRCDGPGSGRTAAGSSLASSAIRWSFVETVLESSASPSSFPPTVPSPGAPLPSTGSLGSVPRLHRYYEGAPTPCRPSRRASSSFARRYRRCARRSLPQVAERCARGPGLLVTPAALRSGSSRDGNDRDLPGSWADPHVRTPCSPTPARPARQALAARQVPPPLSRTTSALSMSSFRGSITRLSHSLSTLRSAGRPAPRKTRFRLVASLCRAGFPPAGSHQKVSAASYAYTVLLPQAFPGATRPHARALDDPRPVTPSVSPVCGGRLTACWVGSLRVTGPRSSSARDAGRPSPSHFLCVLVPRSRARIANPLVRRLPGG